MGDTERLTSWWRDLHARADDVRVAEIGSPDAAGGSNETMLYGIDWAAAGEAQHLDVVVRMGPTEFPLFPDYDLSVQYRCMQEVRARSSVPVPEVLAVDDDGDRLGRPCYVMAAIEGQPVPDFPPFAESGWLFDLAPAAQARVYEQAIDLMAEIHAIDASPPAFGFLDHAAHGPRGVTQCLGRLRTHKAWACRGESHPLLDQLESWLDANLPATTPAPGLTWGDAKLANILYRGTEAVAVLDWEMAALGPGEVDLAYFVVMERYLTEGLGHPPLPGAPDRAAMIERYERAAGRSVTDDFEWYEVLACFRLGSILVRTFERLVAQGIFPADTDLVAMNQPGGDGRGPHREPLISTGWAG